MKTLLPAMLIFSLSALFFSCASGSFVDIDAVRKELNLKSFPEQEDYPESDGVVLYELHNVRLEVNSNYELETRDEVSRIIKLFRNIERYATVEIPVSWSDKLTDISARTIKPDGTVIELKSDDFHTISGTENNAVDYSDIKTVKFTFPAVQKNSLVEFHYIIYSPHPFLQTRWYIQGPLPKLESIYKLTTSVLVVIPPERGGLGWSWRYQWHNCSLGEPMLTKNVEASKALSEQTVTYKWVKRNIPAFESEPVMPPEMNYLQYVEFAPADWETWNDVSEWYNKYYFAPQLNITDKIKDEASNLTTGCTSETEKIRKVFAFVQGLRYVAIELGDGGYRPNQPQIVLEREYGDCKDKSILLISLLRSLGVEAKPVLLLTSGEGIIHTNFPSWDFNHMIVKATEGNGQAYWLDPTVKYCSLGEIPFQDQGTSGLILNDDNSSRIETIPSSTCQDNVENVDIVANLMNVKDAEFHIEIKFEGEYNHRHRDSFSQKSKEEMLKYCKSLIADDYLKAEVTGYSFSSLDSVDSALTLAFDVKVPNAISQQGDLVFLNIDPFKLSDDWDWLGRPTRNYDIQFNFPSTMRKSIHITFPKDKYVVRNLPQNRIFFADGLHYERDYTSNGPGELTATECLEIRSKTLQVQHLDEIKTFVQNMQDKIREQIVLKER